MKHMLIFAQIKLVHTSKFVHSITRICYFTVSCHYSNSTFTEFTAQFSFNSGNPLRGRMSLVHVFKFFLSNYESCTSSGGSTCWGRWTFNLSSSFPLMSFSIRAKLQWLLERFSWEGGQPMGGHTMKEWTLGQFLPFPLLSWVEKWFRVHKWNAYVLMLKEGCP